MQLKRSTIKWYPCWRIIPSIYPPIQLFERVVDPSDLEAVFEIESMTNNRLRHEVGELELIPREHRISGPGSSYIMAAFTHVNPNGSRFSDGTYGAYYATKEMKTAVSESKYHRERFLSWTNESPGGIDMRVLKADLQVTCHDLRQQQNEYQAIYDKDNYNASQIFARGLKNKSSNGIIYNSVRCQDQGECVALFRPDVISNCQVEMHLCYVWDGSMIKEIYKKSSLDRMSALIGS